jgi:hypothetical protein
VRKAIPDFDSKVDKLTTFAIETGGFSIEEINQLIDPAVMGNMAVKMRLAIKKLYDTINAGKSAETKLVKPIPPSLERAGSGAITVEGTRDPAKMSPSEYRRWREQKKE